MRDPPGTLNASWQACCRPKSILQEDPYHVVPAIDQHRKQLTVSVRNEAGDVIERRQVSTRWNKVREFFAALREQAVGDGGFIAILEVCGFNDWLLSLLEEYGCQETVLVQTLAHQPI